MFFMVFLKIEIVNELLTGRSRLPTEAAAQAGSGHIQMLVPFGYAQGTFVVIHIFILTNS
jgi:hypothetical protein